MSIPLIDLVEEYLSALSAERGLSANTIAAYRRDLRQYLESTGGPFPDGDAVERFVSELHLRGLRPATVARKVAAVRGLHGFLLAEDFVGSDPTLLVEAPRRPSPLPKALTVEQAIAMMDAPDRSTVKGRRDSALLEFLYGTGSRVSEAVVVDLPHLDLEDGVAVVTGKGSKQRLVPLGGHAVDAMRRWLPDRQARARGRTDAVFLNLRGNRITRQGVFGIVRANAARAGVPRDTVSPHVLRHSAATHMIEGGADLRTVQELLGHANVSTTQVYTRVSPQHLHEIYVQAHPRSR